jgi:ABC-type transport system involved in multi-copper enzyme maturation permease subunit
MPLILSIFLPAVTMRLWADERKENTFEMLMTFPMKAHEVVLGKYFSALCFFLIALAGTLVIPVMLAVLGNPDPGQIFTSYLGVVLLGGMLLAVGIFISVLCKDQIVAFVVTLSINLAMYLVGTGFIQSYLDNMLPGVGHLLGQLLGFTGHFSSFGRGVIEPTDILFFLSWTVLFLFLNGFYLEIRNRPESKFSLSGGIALVLALGMLLNWVLTGTSLGRLDMTEGRIYTVSSATRKILSQLKAPVHLRLYITPEDKMPTELKNLERDLTDKFEEMRIASGPRLDFNVIHMQAANVVGPEEPSSQSKEAESIEKRMLDKGVKPFSVRALREDSMMDVLIYSSLGIAYKDKAEEIVPRIMPEDLNELEYQIVNRVYKMSREKMPTVALVAPKESVKIPPQLRQMFLQMGRQVPQQEDPYLLLERILLYEKYNVQRVDLTQASPLPEDFDALVVVNPRELDDRQRFEINRALVNGKSVFLAVQKYIWDYQVRNRRVEIDCREEKPRISDLLDAYGLSVSDRILMDENHSPLTMADGSNPLAQLLGQGITLNLPIQIVLGPESMNQNVSITSRLSNLFYLWGSPLEIDEKKLEENGLKVTTLMTTSHRAWTVPGTLNLNQSSFVPPEDGLEKIPVCVLVDGRFPNLFQDKPRPAWPKTQTPGQPPVQEEETDDSKGPFTEYQPAPAKLLLIGGTQMFRKEFLQQANLDFFLNAIDALTLGEDLIDVRTKKPIGRTIEKPSETARTFWKFVNYFLVNSLVAIIGIIIIVRRKRSRETYTAAQQEAREEG